MIPQSIKNNLLLSYKAEVVEEVCSKIEQKMASGKFEAGSDGGLRVYLGKMCESATKKPVERSEDYKRYRADNIFTELVKENGERWFSETVAKIKALPKDVIVAIIKQAEGSYWFNKVYVESDRTMSPEDEKLLTKMFQEGKTPASNLTEDEKIVSDKCLKREKEIKSKALAEASAVVYEIYFKNQLGV